MMGYMIHYSTQRCLDMSLIYDSLETQRPDIRHLHWVSTLYDQEKRGEPGGEVVL